MRTPLRHDAQPYTSPFALENDSLYTEWRQKKLSSISKAAHSFISITDPGQLSQDELSGLLQRCAETNFAFYQCVNEQAMDKMSLKAMAQQIGLTTFDQNACADPDNITVLQESPATDSRTYIPFSSRRLRWHTDGYYNPENKTIRAFIMHCVQAAECGGANELLDHELVYMRLRDEDPECVRSLMHPETMIIPAHVNARGQSRSPTTGPVFSVCSQTGALHMRYTERRHNIEWRQDSATQKARTLLHDTIHSEWNHKVRVRLQAGQGIICNNLLHNRSEFVNSATQNRVMYRARFYNRIKSPRPVGLTEAAA